MKFIIQESICWKEFLSFNLNYPVRIFFLRFFVFSLSLVRFLPHGQITITGKVTDAQTHEPVAFANVLFKGTNTATITDFNGSYSLPRNTKSDTLIVILIGYEKKELKITGDTSLNLDVLLTPLTYEVAEIVVTPGENPAHMLLRNVWKNNELNHIEKLSSYQYENYSRSTVFLRKFSYKPDDERLFKPFSKEFDEFAVKTGEEDIPAIPSYITESISDILFTVTKT